jgi:hypothetical protein
MTKSLPPKANLEQLKNQAKDILKAHKAGDKSCCAVLKSLHQIKDKSDGEILDAEVSLVQVQFALAMEYGFTGWAEMKDTVEGEHPAEAHIEGVLPGSANANSYAKGLSIMFSHVGPTVDYDTVMGDSGQCFIFQALTDKSDNVGYWPMNPWGMRIRQQFLSSVLGQEILFTPARGDEQKADADAAYRKYHEPYVLDNIGRGVPLLAFRRTWSVVTGYDEGKPPLLAHSALSEDNCASRLEDYPRVIAHLGKNITRIERQQADLDAIRHAVSLGRDTVEHKTGWTAGIKSFAPWIEALRDTENLGETRWHANVCLHLGINRRSAVRYLEAMGKRWMRGADALLKAAHYFQATLDILDGTDFSNDSMMIAENRIELATLAEDMVKTESAAFTELEKALAAMA